MKIEALNSRAAKLAKLVKDHGDYEFEGYTWLRCNLVEIGDHLGMHKNTIRNIIIKPPFKYITRNTKENGRHLLVRIGDGQTETDHLFILRTVWAKGLIYYNAALAYSKQVQTKTGKTKPFGGMPTPACLMAILICRGFGNLHGKPQNALRIAMPSNSFTSICG